MIPPVCMQEWYHASISRADIHYLYLIQFFIEEFLFEEWVPYYSYNRFRNYYFLKRI